VLLVVIGITYGTAIGLLGNWLLFRHIEGNRRRGEEPLKGVGGVFFIRYLLDAIGLVVFWLVTRSAYGIVAAALSITVAVKISLFIIYARKGGRID
jgi:hypothetical protein